MVVAATLLAVALAAGWIRLQNPVVVAPSRSSLPTPAESPIDGVPTASPIDSLPTIPPGPTPRVATPTCASATDLNDIRDTWRPRNTEASWESGPLPLDGNVAGDITAIAFDLPEVDLVETPRAVVLVRPNTGKMCRLAVLPPAFSVYGLHWSPSGDALAIVLHPPEAGPAEVLVWSRLGITRPWVGDAPQGVGVAWSPDGSTLAILTEERAELVFADGSPTAQIDCVGCAEDFVSPPAGPYYFGRPVWSPDGSKIALTMQGFHGSRVALVNVGQRRGAVLDLDKEGIEPIAWPDNETLMFALGTRLFVAPVANPREDRLQIDLPFDGNFTRYNFARDLRHVAYVAVSGERTSDLIVRDLTDGSIVFQVQSTSGETSAIRAFAWAPDSRQLVYTRWGAGQPEIQDMWVAVIDPREDHHITKGAIHLPYTELLRSGLDGGSWRESAPGQP
jgi:dipeptidyl aminopeptidase/acylaminoacyl peptidase